VCPSQICVRLEKLYVRLVLLNYPAGIRDDVILLVFVFAGMGLIIFGVLVITGLVAANPAHRSRWIVSQIPCRRRLLDGVRVFRELRVTGG
jgi:hypothetical protein